MYCVVALRTGVEAEGGSEGVRGGRVVVGQLKGSSSEFMGPGVDAGQLFALGLLRLGISGHHGRQRGRDGEHDPGSGTPAWRAGGFRQGFGPFLNRGLLRGD